MNNTEFINKHQNFPSDSRLWVYSASRMLTELEHNIVKLELDKFIHQWAAHGIALKASAAVLYNTFIVLIVDENIEPASGCSIDSSVRLIKEIGTQLNINFFDRNNVVYLKNNEITFTKMSKLKELSNEIVFNTSITSFQDFLKKFELPFLESALSNIKIDDSFTYSL